MGVSGLGRPNLDSGFSRLGSHNVAACICARFRNVAACVFGVGRVGAEARVANDVGSAEWAPGMRPAAAPSRGGRESAAGRRLGRAGCLGSLQMMCCLLLFLIERRQSFRAIIGRYIYCFIDFINP